MGASKPRVIFIERECEECGAAMCYNARKAGGFNPRLCADCSTETGRDYFAELREGALILRDLLLVGPR